MKKSHIPANQEQPKNCQDFGKTNNEGSRGLTRDYIGRNWVSKFRSKLIEDEDIKTTKIEEIEPKSTIECA